ncbi:Pentapeptide repeat-containing protein [Candidatus Trichorickettsia mobilis]|uniref:Pentapeptide repeat-containing protein n=1 Tax=Candidatus Trichorickettsia mobilis TaxID=1346319 RepID=A0ABZ0UW38_9RICK|nr:pentapeptide repeat-containing protein [Candidatus Trichorickettsia mobilis]WPY00847.1 Pentapeptide repeat-containing protein [Candidatus Trichorickettsia mobilis]
MAEESELTLEQKRKSWEGLNLLIDGVLAKKKGTGEIFDRFIKDYTKPNPDWSFGLAWKAISEIGFGAAIKLWWNSDKITKAFKDPDFQKDLLEKPKLLPFIQDITERLPQLTQALSGIGITVVKDNPELFNEKSMTALKGTIANTANLTKLKNMAVEAISSKANMSKIATDAIALAINDRSFQQFLQHNAPTFGTTINKMLPQFMDMNNLDKTLNQYGLATKDLPQVTKIFPLLLDKPEVLQKVFNQFQKSDYPEMVKTLLSNVKDNSNIEKYFSENRDLFVNVLNTTIEQTPALKGMGLKGELYDIVPALLKHPKELIEIIDAQKTGNYTEITQKFSELAKDPQLQGALAKAGVELTAKAVEATIGVKVTDDIGQIFTILIKNNQVKEKVEQIAEAYQQGKWTNVAKETCLLLENHELKDYIKSNTENLKQIVNKVVGELKKDPESVVSKYLAGADVGQIANTILQNPEPMRHLVQAYDDGNKTEMAKYGTQILATIAYNDPTSAANIAANVTTQGIRAAYQWATGAGTPSAEAKAQQQEWVTQTLKDSVYAYRDTTEPLKFNDYLKKDLEPELKTNPNLINSLLQNMTIAGKSADEKLKLENLIIEGNNFANSKLENVSFKDTIFKNTTFDGASFKNTDFTGATIDAATFKSIRSEVEKGNISLNGVKFVGDFSNADFLKVPLDGADFTGITSMQNANLKDINLTKVKLPEGKILADTYNLDKAVVTAGAISQETIQAQQDKVIDKAVIQIARVVTDRHEPAMTDAQKTALNTTIKELVRDGGAVGEYIKKGLEATPEDTLNKKFPIDPKNITHVADYTGKTSNIMTILLENKTSDIATIRNTISANIIADEVTTSLFKEGTGRGQDGLTIKQITQQAVVKFAQDNPEIKTGLATALDNPEQKPQLINGITETIRDPNNKIIEKTWAGTVRMDSDRIQLKTNISVEDAANRIKTQINDTHGVITGPDLKRMIAEGKEISLENKKLVGDFSGIDLSGKSLKLADLTKVTSMDNVNLKETNLTDVKFPENKQLFVETYNFNKTAITDKGAFADIIKQQGDKAIEKVVNAIAEVAGNAGTPMSTEQKTALNANIKELIRESGAVKKYINESLAATPKDITDKNFPIDPAKITHVADYEGKTSNIMTILLENRTNDLETTRNAVAAQGIADEVTTNLFKEGTGRGKDGLTIKQLTQQATTKFTQDNPGVDLNKFLGTLEGGKLIAEITEVIKNNATEKTMLGAVTRNDERIQLKANIPVETIANKITAEMNVACGTIKLNEEEIKTITSTST